MSNLSIIKGNVVKKPELRQTQSGIKVAMYTIASSRPNPKAKGEFLTDYFNIVAWGDLADTCANTLDKGTRVCAFGRFQTRSYDDKDGKKVYVTELMQDELWIAPKKAETFESGSTIPDSEMPF